MAATPFSPLAESGRPGLALRTWAHFAPFQCSTSVRAGLDLMSEV